MNNKIDEVPGIVLRENPYAPEAGPVLGDPNQDSCSEESEEEPMVPDPIVHPEPPPAPPAVHMLPAPLNFDDMDQEAGAAFAIAERARNTKPGLVAFKSDLGCAGVFQALPKDQIHVWFNDTGDNTAAYIHNGRTRYGYDVGGGYVLKVGTKQAFGDEVAITALLPKVAATIIGAGSTTLQVLLSGRPWEFRSHLVAWSIVEKVELLTDFGSRNQIHPQWSLYAFALVSFFECLEKIELYCSKETTSKCCGEQNICLLFQCLPFCTTYFQRLISFMLVHAGFVFTYTPVAAGPLRGQDARKVLLEADRLFSKSPPSPPL